MAALWESAPLADAPASNGPAWADAPSADSPAKANLVAARDVRPDAAAEVVKLARRYPTDPDALYRNLAETKTWAEFEDNERRVKAAPQLEAWIAGQPARAKVARDDLETLSNIEHVLKEWRGPAPSVGSVVSGLAKSVPQGFRAASEGLTGQIADAFVALGLSPDDEVAKRERARRMAQATSASAYTTPDFESATASAVYGGVSSTLRMAPGLALSVAMRSPVPALAAAGVQTQAEAYAKYRGRGGSGLESFVGATGEGAVEVATELLPMGFLANQLGRTGMREFAVGLLARELPTEQVATLLQDAIDTGVANPDKTWGEYIAERPGAAYATLVSTLTQSALMGGAHAVGQRVTGYERQVQEAEVSALRMEFLAKLGEASKLKGRDAETFKEFVAQVAEEGGDAPTEFFIDGQTLLNTLNQSGVSREELAAIAPVVAAQIEAAQTGDVRVPVSEFLAAGEAFTAPLIDHLRSSPEAMSRLEAQEFIKERGDRIKQEVETELGRADEQATFRESIASVQQRFQTELDQTKRFTPDVNKAYASLLANFYGAQAQRLGMTPDELLQKYQLRVRAEGVAGAQTLEQGRLYPMAPRGEWYGEGTFDADGGRLVYVSPDEYIAAVRPLAMDEESRENIDILKRHIEDGKTLDPLLIRANGKEDGRHRAYAAKELGIAQVPVIAYGDQFSKAPGVLNQGEKTPRAQLSFAPDITASPSVISLLDGADLSSTIHEASHFFLEVQGDLARRIQQQVGAGATVSELERGIVADMGKLLEWFGVTGSPEKSALMTWADMGLDERREMHEKFARGFEAYTMEGQAPSIELQGIFSRFRSWLVQVYQTLRGLNVTLTDDVRAVMGRMIATDQAIEEAEAQRSMGPLFRDAETAGMTLDEFNAYQALAGRATDAAIQALQVRGMKDMKWLSRARDKALKARQAEVEEQRREVLQEVRAEVYAEPVYRAWQYLTSKSDDAAVSGKLRTQELREAYGVAEDADWRRLSARRMTSDTTGRSPESVAEEMGFDSGDALVKALADAMPPTEVIDARTDQRMLETFGDITSPEALARAADEAVHNEVRARFIASELKALQEANDVRADTGKRTKTGRRVTVNVMAKAAKDYADQIIARLRVRDIRPAQYTAAESRSAKLAEKAFAAGKTDEAALHKRNQMVNNYATKAAYAAQDEVAAVVRYFRRFDSPSKTIDKGYQDQIDQLLERFDFKPASLKEIDRRKGLAEFVAEQQAMGNEPDIPDQLLNEASRKSYKDMTLEELRGLKDTVKQIEHLGRLKNKLLLARDQRAFDAIADEMAATIVKYGGAVRPVELEGAKGVKPWLEGVAAQHRKLASLFRQMDGGNDDGPMFERIGRAMNERSTMEDVMVEKAAIALNELYAPLMKMRGGITGARSKVFIKEINASLTRGGRLAVALNWGNEQNRQRIRDGDKWSDAQVQAILKTLTSTELEFVNGVWRYIDTFWKDIAAKEERLSGVAPEKVAAEPFVLMSADGVETPMRGGYYPLKYDSDRSDRAEQQEAAQVAKEMLQGAFTKATTRRGHTKERVKEVKRAVRKDLNVITQHITQVVHDLAWHEWLIDTNRLLRDDRVVSAIRDHYGPKVLKTMRDGVMGIATADVVPQTDIDKALLLLRSNVTRATMGASLTTAFLQPFGLTQSIVRIGPRYVLRGVARWGGEAVRMENTMTWIREKSEFMRLRSKTFNRELREIRGAVDGKSKVMQVVDGGLFWMMQKMQMVADVPTWVGQYEKTMSEGPAEDTDEARDELEARAVAMADRAVLESQGGGSTKDMAEVQRKHPMLTQFYSYFSVTMNLTAEATANTDFSDPRAVAGWLGDMALLMVIPAILPSLLLFALKGGGEDDDETSMAKRIAQWQLGYLLGTIVGVRELSGAVSGFDYVGPPVGRIVADIGKAGKQTAQGEIDEPAVLAYINLVGTAFGIPVVQATRSYKGWKAWSEGQEGAGPQSVLLGPPPKG